METTFDKASSILNTVKKYCGLGEDYNTFDQDILVLINGAILDLSQNGIGPSSGFNVVDKSATWEDFIGDSSQLQAVKSYVYLKVKLLFDPPLSSSVIESMNRMIAELEWRLNVAVE